MADLKDAMAFVCLNYPGSDLSNAKLTKILYLADWKSALSEGTQITPIEWKFNHYGPFVSDVIDVANANSAFTVSTDWTPFGNRRTLIGFKGPPPAGLSKRHAEILLEIIGKVAPLSFDAFLKLVYSTYPVVVSDRGTVLELPKLATEYQSSGLAPR